jgi:hypothetical protein
MSFQFSTTRIKSALLLPVGLVFFIEICQFSLEGEYSRSLPMNKAAQILRFIIGKKLNHVYIHESKYLIELVSLQSFFQFEYNNVYHIQYNQYIVAQIFQSNCLKMHMDLYS